MPKVGEVIASPPLKGESLLTLKRLLAEYIRTIEKIGDQVVAIGRIHFNEQTQDYSGRSRMDPNRNATLAETFARIRPSAEDLDRQASQLVEYGRIDELDKAEFLLRLAELESAITITECRLAGAVPRFRTFGFVAGSCESREGDGNRARTLTAKRRRSFIRLPFRSARGAKRATPRAVPLLSSISRYRFASRKVNR